MPEKIVSKIKKVMPKGLAKKLPQEIGVVLINSQESRKLNLIYRNKNKPTNVLSFFYPHTKRGLRSLRGKKSHPRYGVGVYGPEYGEILICPQIVKKETKATGNTQPFQMTSMILHGMIHLAGVHHEKSPADFRRFSKLENGLLKVLFAH